MPRSSGGKTAEKPLLNKGVATVSVPERTLIWPGWPLWPQDVPGCCYSLRTSLHPECIFLSYFYIQT